MPHSRPNLQRYWPLLFLFVGSLLRLVWISDMEWKYDERWMFETAQSVAKGLTPWPVLGMPSGGGVTNPGLSVWCFAVLSYFTSDPLQMAFLVAGLNVLALFGFWAWIRRFIPRERKDVWFLGLILLCVSPLPVILSRKIWAQCLLIPWMVPLLWAHALRSHWLAAFLWGLLGATLGQIHMSGFFVAAGLTLISLMQKRLHISGPNPHWPSWVVGSALGAVPLVPWMIEMTTQASHASNHWWEIFTFKFYSLWWAVGWGINLKYSLREDFFREFIALPRIAGFPTYLMAAAHLFLLGVGLSALWTAAKMLRRDPLGFRMKEAQPELWFYFTALFWAAGGLMTFSGFSIFSHYLLAIYPILFATTAYQLGSRYLKCAVIAAQLATTVVFLCHVHFSVPHAPKGDYGVPYRHQIQ